MRIAVLGPVRVVRDEVELDLGPHKQRALLAALALSPDRVVPSDTIVDLLWGDAPPPAVAASLHGYVAALRRVLEPTRAARGEPAVLVTVGHGYVLRVPPEAVDAVRFAAAVEDAH